MGRLLELAAGLLGDDGRDLEIFPGAMPPRIRFDFDGEHTRLDCTLEAYEDTERLCFLSSYPGLVPAPRRLEAAEYLTRVNFGVLVGNFELDFESGLVRFKTSADVEGLEPSPTFLRNLVDANLNTASKYYPGLMKVLYANMSPSDAVAVVRAAS